MYTIANLTVVNVWYSTIISQLHTMLYSPCLTWASTTITDASDNKEKRYIFLYGQFPFYSIVFCLIKANRLSTLSLQHDKRMDDEMRGGKRKIRLVQEQVHVMLKNSSTVRVINNTP